MLRARGGDTTGGSPACVCASEGGDRGRMRSGPGRVAGPTPGGARSAPCAARQGAEQHARTSRILRRGAAARPLTPGPRRSHAPASCVSGVQAAAGAAGAGVRSCAGIRRRRKRGCLKRCAGAGLGVSFRRQVRCWAVHRRLARAEAEAGRGGRRRVPRAAGGGRTRGGTGRWQAAGYRVVRVPAEMVMRDLQAAVAVVVEAIEAAG